MLGDNVLVVHNAREGTVVCIYVRGFVETHAVRAGIVYHWGRAVLACVFRCVTCSLVFKTLLAGLNKHNGKRYDYVKKPYLTHKAYCKVMLLVLSA